MQSCQSIPLALKPYSRFGSFGMTWIAGQGHSGGPVPDFTGFPIVLLVST